MKAKTSNETGTSGRDGTVATAASITRSYSKLSSRKPQKAVALVEGATAEETERNLAALVTSPAMAAYRVITGAEAKSGLGELIDVPQLMAELRRQADAVNGGSLTNVEAMLANQATALQSLFARLAERAMTCDNVAPFEANMRMALRSQSQCRATLETLAAIKNPPVIIARQANVSTGPQQVNNGILAEAASRTREFEIEPNKLLEAEHGERMDRRTTGAAIDADSDLAPVGPFNGAAIG